MRDTSPSTVAAEAASAPPEMVRTAVQAAWLAIAAGLSVQVAVVASRALLDRAWPGAALLADLGQAVTWSTFVCAAIAIGTVASHSRAALTGLLGLVSAPLAWAAAKAVQKGLQGLVGAPVDQTDGFFYLICALKGLEYGALGFALGRMVGQPWATLLAHLLLALAVGLISAVLFVGLQHSRGVRLGKVPPASKLVGLGVNEILFPLGCSLVIFFGQRLRWYEHLVDGGGANPEA